FAEEGQEKIQGCESAGQHQGLVAIVQVEVIMRQQVRGQCSAGGMTKAGDMEMRLSARGIAALQRIDVAGSSEDLKQPQQVSRFSAIEWACHVIRSHELTGTYDCGGRFVSTGK